jgi:DNA replicative helicase MCM subunit Mcm2 (Cdc46/Mcm family)
MPRSIVVILQAELVDKFLPGDKVTVVGYMVRKWRFLYKGERGTLATVFHANNLKSCLNSSRENSVDGEYADIKYFSDYWKSHEKTKFSGRDKILRSFCPQLFGMYTVKLALLLTIISGSRLRSQLDTRKESEPADQEIGKKSIPGDSIQNESMSVREQSHMLIVGG